MASASLAQTSAQARAARMDALVPWIPPVIATMLYALFVDGAERWLAVGLALGLGLGAGLAWYVERRLVHAARAGLARMEDDFRADADGRVAMVIRQFQWAVNDVSALQVMLQKAKEAARHAEDRARLAEHQVRLLEHELYKARGTAAAGAGEPALSAPRPETPGEFISS